MIYLFHGEKYFRNSLLQTWKNAFSNKYSELNIFEIKNYKEYDINFFHQTLFSNGFFSEKSFVIIEEFPFEVGESDYETNILQEYFLEQLEKVSAEHTVVFSNTRVDKRSKLYKHIWKIWEYKSFTIETPEDLLEKLQQLYGSVAPVSVFKKFIELKWISFDSIQSEIEKILITQSQISLADLEWISKDVEESIFEIINDILMQDISGAIKKIRLLNRDLDNSYLLYNSLVANLRIYFYIYLLRSKKLSSTEIKKTLPFGNRSFLVDKNYAISGKKFFSFYEKIIWLDVKMKQGKLLWSESDEMMFEIEKSLCYAL